MGRVSSPACHTASRAPGALPDLDPAAIHGHGVSGPGEPGYSSARNFRRHASDVWACRRVAQGRDEVSRAIPRAREAGAARAQCDPLGPWFLPGVCDTGRAMMSRVVDRGARAASSVGNGSSSAGYAGGGSVYQVGGRYPGWRGHVGGGDVGRRGPGYDVLCFLPSGLCLWSPEPRVASGEASVTGLRACAM